jgi:hypothetical protein
MKNITTWEGQRFEFRLEAQNATNTPMFGDPAGWRSAQRTSARSRVSAAASEHVICN